jgi:hypothetical protein
MENSFKEGDRASGDDARPPRACHWVGAELKREEIAAPLCLYLRKSF